MNATIEALQKEIYEKTLQLMELQQQAVPEAVPNYAFETLHGSTSLLELFGTRTRLLVIHNMGDRCRYCTLWADGLNGLLPHLEDAMSVVLVSGDAPERQREFANSRGWRFRLASHAHSDYLREQTVLSGLEGGGNYPGAVVYTREDTQIFRKNACVFGPGDLYCALWPLIAMAGLKEGEWTPQFRYWQRPVSLSDGGQNINRESRDED